MIYQLSPEIGLGMDVWKDTFIANEPHRPSHRWPRSNVCFGLFSRSGGMLSFVRRVAAGGNLSIFPENPIDPSLIIFMKIYQSIAATIGLLAVAGAEPIFQDGFESGLHWAVTKTNDGRARATGEDGPAAGAAHLVLDDSSNDAVFSVIETSIDLDLSDKKNVTLAFMAKSLGNEAHAPPAGNFTTTRNYDGVAISCDGGSTWRSVQSLATVGPDWTAFSLPLDSSVTALGGSYGPGFLIRFSAYDNSAAPLDGIAIDSVSVTGDVDPRITVELPGTVAEGSGPHIGYVSLNLVQATPVTIALSAGSTALTVPASVTIGAGELWASFEFNAAEDSLLTLSRSITVNASATGFSVTPGAVVVTDNETASATLTLPTSLQEGILYSNNATVGISPTPAVPIIFTLAANPAAELTIPATVTIPAGQSQVTFTARANNDTKIDGDIPVSVSANAPGAAALNAVTTAVDNESRTLTLTLPTYMLEGSASTGTVAISGTLADALPVNLEIVSSGDVILPASVFIPVGATQVNFPITAVNNSVLDGTRTMTLTATAAGFTSSAKALVVRDNDPASYSLSTLTELVPTGSPQSLTVKALDLAGNVISSFAGTLNLDLLLPDGNALPVSPASITLGSGGWTGTITLPVSAASGLRLRASDAGGLSAVSTTFDPIRSLELTTADLIWNPIRNVIYASVPSTAGGPYASQVVEIDPATLEIRRSVFTIQNPGQLALTSGGEYLYVAQNGNGRVVKIDPATMSMVSSFAVGTDSAYGGTLYASDICTVAGQPELLVISRKSASGSPDHRGVAVYENGVARAVTTQEHSDSVRIEPSADPAKFWCSTSYAVRRLMLDGSGISVAATTDNSGGLSEIRAIGDRIYGTSGAVLDGNSLLKLGTIPSSGPHCPDAVLNRIYFIEKSYPYGSIYDRIGSYDATNFTLIRQMSMPSVGSTAGSLIRVGDHGLAFRSATNIHLVNSAPLVPASLPADLAVTVSASPAPVMAGQLLTYTVQVTNLGTNTARGVVLSSTLSSGQTLQSAVSSSGSPVISGSLVTWLPPDLANAASATLTLNVVAGSAGSISCTAKAVSNVVDPDFSNNVRARLVNVGYQTATDSINPIRLAAKSLIADPTRNLLWAAIPSTVEAPFGNSVVSIDPLTGLVSDPISIDASPTEGAIALSPNGRYLYVGLSGITSVARIDLSQASPPVMRIPTTISVQDIEVLDGDGTSIIVASGTVEVIDETGPRPTRVTGVANNIERTATPGIFFGFYSGLTSYPCTRLSVTATGVQVIQTVNELMDGGTYSSHVSGAGDRIVSDGGKLVDSGNLSMVASLPVWGTECLDGEHHRAYIVTGNALHAFNSDTGQATGTFTLPAPASGDGALSCVRWGIDGMAILGDDGIIYVGRWSGVIPSATDGNSDGIADAWAAAHFGTTVVNPGGDGDGDGLPDAMEYLFATSPVAAGASPLRFSLETVGGTRTILLRFPRRAGLAPGSYCFELSEDVGTWLVAPGASETVVSTATVDGVEVEQVEARIPMAWPDRGFARIKWLHP